MSSFRITDNQESGIIRDDQDNIFAAWAFTGGPVHVPGAAVAIPRGNIHWTVYKQNFNKYFAAPEEGLRYAKNECIRIMRETNLEFFIWYEFQNKNT